MKVFIFKGFIDLGINHDEFASLNNVLKEYNQMKESKMKSKILKMVWRILHKNNGYCVSFKRSTANKNQCYKKQAKQIKACRNSSLI